jgi:branched-chain amino acid aminotransferase
MYIYYNDTFIHAAELSITSSNRAFKYGDGLFESLLIVKRNPPFLSYNLRRLINGMQLLEIEIPRHWNLAFFSSTLYELCKKNKIQNARCKITVWRSGGGLYGPVSNHPELLIELTSIHTSKFVLNKKGLVLNVYPAMQKPVLPISACKTCNAIPYVLATKYAAEQKYDDVVLFNTAGSIADSTNSNVFIVKNKTLITTPEMNGGIAGTMQHIICDHAASWGLKLQRKHFGKKELLTANEILLTNAIHGVRWVGQFGLKSYKNTFAKKLITFVNKLIPDA